METHTKPIETTNDPGVPQVQSPASGRVDTKPTPDTSAIKTSDVPNKASSSREHQSSEMTVDTQPQDTRLPHKAIETTIVKEGVFKTTPPPSHVPHSTETLKNSKPPSSTSAEIEAKPAPLIDWSSSIPSPKLPEEAALPKSNLANAPSNPMSAHTFPPLVFDTQVSIFEARSIGLETVSTQYGASSLTHPTSPAGANIAPTVQTAPPATLISISQQISTAFVSTNDKAVEIRLDPEELGQVRIVLTGKEGAMNVTIFSDKTEVLDLMRRHSDQLEMDFSSIGYEGAQFSFEKEHEEDVSEPQEDSIAQTVDEADALPRQKQYVLGSGTQLDLRF